MAEQFAAEDIPCEATAVEVDKRSVGVLATVVDGFGKHFLADPGIAQNQYRQRRICRLAGFVRAGLK